MTTLNQRQKLTLTMSTVDMSGYDDPEPTQVMATLNLFVRLPLTQTGCDYPEPKVDTDRVKC